MPSRPAPPRPAPRPASGSLLPAVPHTPPLLDPTVEPVPTERRLPAHRGKVERITDHLAGVSENLRAMVELRLDLVKREIQDEIEEKVAFAKAAAAAGVLGALAGLFLLVALALGIAALLILVGLSRPLSYFLGFLLLAVILGGAGYVAWRKLSPPASKPIEVERKTLSEDTAGGRKTVVERTVRVEDRD